MKKMAHSQCSVSAYGWLLGGRLQIVVVAFLCDKLTSSVFFFLSLDPPYKKIVFSYTSTISIMTLIFFSFALRIFIYFLFIIFFCLT